MQDIVHIPPFHIGVVHSKCSRLVKIGFPKHITRPVERLNLCCHSTMVSISADVEGRLFFSPFFFSVTRKTAAKNYSGMEAVEARRRIQTKERKKSDSAHLYSLASLSSASRPSSNEFSQALSSSNLEKHRYYHVKSLNGRFKYIRFCTHQICFLLT